MVATIIAFIIVICTVVVSHEFGHFLLAKVNNVKVVEFAVGMGPAILKFTKGETRYVLRLLPIGGACVMDMDDGIFDEENQEEAVEDSSIVNAEESIDSLQEEDDYVQINESIKFNDAGIWTRISIILAGPLFNIILAFLLCMILVSVSGETLPIITDTMEGYPAQEAGIQKGDRITKIDGVRVYLQDEISLEVFLSGGTQPMELEYVRDGQKYSTTIVPKYSEKDGMYYMGLMFGEHVEAKGLDVFKYSAYEVRYWTRYITKSLLMLIQGKAKKEDVSGPVGIAAAIDQTIEATKPYGMSAVLLNLINFTVLLSVNLGVFNMIPIPALDGGRLLFLLVELLRGKPVPREKEGIVHAIGFAIIIILMVVVLYNDISRLFFKM